VATNRWTGANLVREKICATRSSVDWVSGACMMVRARRLKPWGGMDERFFLYWEDAI